MTEKQEINRYTKLDKETDRILLQECKKQNRTMANLLLTICIEYVERLKEKK